MLFVYSFIGQDLDSTVFYSITYTLVTTAIYALLPVFVLVVILTFSFNWMQFGMIMTPMKFDLQKLDPITGLKNVFSLKKGLEALKLTFKLLIIFTVMVILF